MARPRQQRNKDLPLGLLYRTDRGCYEFTRTDGSKRSLGKDRKNAKRLAIQYNSTYRVDVELTHAICSTKIESKQLHNNTKPLYDFLPKIFDKIAEDKDWAEGTLKNHKIMFVLILNYFGKLQASSVNLEHVNDFLYIANPTDSKGVYNRFLGLLKVLFNYCVSDSVMKENPASKKIRRTMNAKDEATITRLTIDDFAQIHEHAGKLGYPWLQIAMELSLQTSHAVLEISKLKYADIEEHIRIQRQKNKKKNASRVLIPMNDEITDIIQRSRQDSILSPFVVHYMRQRKDQNRSLAKGLEHNTQLRSVQISRVFSDIRDELGLFDDIEKRIDRPSFHDIRSLSIQIQEENGFDAQKRAAHSERASTDIYKKGYNRWNEVPDVVIDWRQNTLESETA
jgi:integrase